MLVKVLFVLLLYEKMSLVGLDWKFINGVGYIFDCDCSYVVVFCFNFQFYFWKDSFGFNIYLIILQLLFFFIKSNEFVGS